MIPHYETGEAISYLEEKHKTRAERRSKLREALRHSSDPKERLAVGLAEHGHTIKAIMERCGVPELIARTLVTGGDT